MSEIDTINQDFIKHMAAAMDAYQRLLGIKSPVRHLPMDVTVEVLD
jgi:hypothetical protein